MTYLETCEVIAAIVAAYDSTVEYTANGCRINAREMQKQIEDIPGGADAFAALINYNAPDGRISQQSKKWAASRPAAYQCHTERGEFLNAGNIHLCILNSIAESFAIA